MKSVISRNHYLKKREIESKILSLYILLILIENPLFS
jgi:hypothetical protein